MTKVGIDDYWIAYAKRGDGILQHVHPGANVIGSPISINDPAESIDRTDVFNTGASVAVVYQEKNTPNSQAPD